MRLKQNVVKELVLYAIFQWTLNGLTYQCACKLLSIMPPKIKLNDEKCNKGLCVKFHLLQHSHLSKPAITVYQRAKAKMW
jgi:hypothetical protein